LQKKSISSIIAKNCSVKDSNQNLDGQYRILSSEMVKI